MGYEVVWSERAARELREVFDYIATADIHAAEKLVSRIADRAELLGAVPLMGTVFGRRTSGLYRQIVIEKYRVIYRVDETSKRVEVVCVWHGARRDPDLTP